MSNLIIEQENQPILIVGDKFLLNPKVSEQIAIFEKQAKEIKELQDKLKASLLSAMEELGIVKLDTEELTITYVAETYRESFDSKALKEEDEATYNKYIKISPVKSSIRIKVK